MAFIEPMHRNKPNITYLLTCMAVTEWIQNSVVSIGRGPEMEKSGKDEQEVIATSHGSDEVI